MSNRRQKITFFIAIGLVALAISMIPTLADTASAAYKYGDVSVVTKVLSRNYTGADWVYNLYNVCRGLVNIIALVVLLIIAFANILHINIETYTMKKLLLPLIIALILANLALPIFAIFSRVVDEFQRLSLFKPDYFNYDYVMGSLNPFRKMGPGITFPHIGITAVLLGAIVASFASGFGIIVGLVFFVIMFGLLAVLNMIMAFRPYIIYTMAAVSPVAIILSVLPMTQPYFKRWLGIIVPWMIMPLACFFIINIGTLITSTASSMMIPGSGTVGSIIGYFLPALIKLGLLLLAIRFPFMIEKDIGGVINKIGQFAAKQAPMAGGRIANKAYDIIHKQASLEAPKKVENLLQQVARGEKAGEDVKEDLLGMRMAMLRNSDEYKGMNDDEKKKAEEKESQEVDKELEKLGSEEDEERQRAHIGKFMRDTYNRAAASQYLNSVRGRAGLTIASIASMPLGITVALKRRDEVERAKAEKTSGKALMRHLELVPGRGGQVLRQYLGGGALLGELGAANYWSDIVGGDLNRVRDPDMIKRYMDYERLKKKLIANELRKEGKNLKELEAIIDAQGVDSDEGRTADRVIRDAGRRVADHATRLNDNDESINQFARTMGISSAEAATFSIGFEKLGQEYYRLASRGGRDPEAVLETIREGQDLMREDLANIRPEEAAGAPGGRGTAAAGPSGVVGSAEAAPDPQTISLLRQVAENTKAPGSVPQNLASTIRTAMASGIKPGATSQIEAQQVETLSRIERALLTAGSKPDQAGRIIKALRSSSAVDIGTTVEGISRSEGVSPEVARLLGEFQSQVIGKTATIATMEPAQSVQRYATALAPVAQQRPEQIGQINAACEVIIKAETGIGTFTPDQVNQAKQTIATALPGSIGTTKEGGYEVGAETAATVSRALEIITPGD